MKNTKLQSTEEALLKSEERYRAFISQSTEGIWRCELEKPLLTTWSIKKQLAHMFAFGYLAECNDAMAKMYGFTKANEIVGTRIKDLLIPTDPANIEYLTAFIKSGYKLSNSNSKEKDKYGNIHFFENNLVGIIEDGYLQRAWGTQRDITTQKYAEERQAFLENISNKLVVSLNHDVTLQGIAQLIVPYFADYCRIAIVDEENRIKEITVNHTDPTKVALAEALYKAYKDEPASTFGIPSLLKKGKVEIIEKINDGVLAKYNTSKKLLKIVKDLQLKSYMGVPLIARGKIIGAMTFSSIQKYYTKDDLKFVEEIAKRIALTLDNIWLFKEAQKEIEEREKIAEILLLEQERLNLAQEAAEFGVIEIDFPSKTVQWSVQLEKLYGVEPGEFKGTFDAWLKKVHPEDRVQLRKALYGQSKHDAFIEAEFRIVLPYGAMRWIYLKAQTFFDKNHKPIRSIGINIDITERKQAIINSSFLAEAGKILSSSLDYETTLQNVASLAVPQIADWCVIHMIDNNNKFHYIALKHKDPKKVKLVEKLLKEFPADPQSKFTVGVAKALTTGKPQLHSAMTDSILQMRSESKEHLSLFKKIGVGSTMIVPILTQKKAIGVISFVTSETRRKFTEFDLTFAEELAHRASLAIENAALYKRAQDAITLRDDFISVASHELKTPITSVKIFTQVLQKHAKQTGDTQSIQSLEKMNKQIDKLTDLIYNLLDISKMQKGKLEYTMRKFSFDDMVRETVEILQHMTAKHKLILKGEAKKAIYGDEDRLSQVVSNLTLNAIKYSPSADKVLINIASTPTELHVTVKDFGIGMNKEHLKKVFGRFYRVSGNKDKTFPGLGIGLYISKEIINRHKGKLWVESRAGKGSTFHFTLPFKSTPPSPNLRAT